MCSVRTLILTVSSAAILMTAVSCSSGPAPPAAGTPAFYWSAAEQNFNAGDYVKTSEQLEDLTKTENEYTAKAWPWRLVVLSGVAQGYIDLSDQFDSGMNANKANTAPFRKYASDFRSIASRRALQFAEALGQYEKVKPAEQITLAFSYPLGSANLPTAINRAANGLLPAAAEVEAAQTDMLRRGVLLSACAAAGAANDTAKAADLLKSGSATVPRAVFMRALGESMIAQASLFEHRKLDLPDRQKYFLTHGIEILKAVPEDKELKELVSKAESGLKKL
jgi:hypothetical protein